MLWREREGVRHYVRGGVVYKGWTKNNNNLLVCTVNFLKLLLNNK